MFLTGSADLTDRLQSCPTFDPAEGREAVLEQSEVLSILWETDFDFMSEVLPPGVHPSIPPAVNWMFLRAATSPVGPFTLAQTRIVCRVGRVPRAFLSHAVVDSAEAAEFLTRHWAYQCSVGTVRLRHSYPMVTGEVSDAEGRLLLAVDLLDPDPFTGDVFLAPGLHLARQGDTDRLLEVSAKISHNRIDRGRPRLRAFEPGAWREPNLTLTTPVAGFSSRGDLTLPKIETSYDPYVPVRTWPAAS